MQQSYDWNEVVERKPKGYVELNNGKEVIHGPIQEVRVDDMDNLHIITKWLVRMSLDDMGIPITGKWEVMSQGPKDLGPWPTFMLPYVIENTPEKGPRVRFGTNILYLEMVEGVDPSTVEGLEAVETA